MMKKKKKKENNRAVDFECRCGFRARGHYVSSPFAIEFASRALKLYTEKPIGEYYRERGGGGGGGGNCEDVRGVCGRPG